MSEPRYAIGIDLGTTHCALSYVDLDASEGERALQEILPIPQLTAPGTVEERALLPSFLYLSHAAEFAAGELDLPWRTEPDFAVGEMARARGAVTPIRLVSSAKSWLGHGGVDRHAALLPADAPEEVTRISPVEATVRYLAHLREAWNHAHPDVLFGQQELTVTIPASFDPAARELTAESARTAGYERLTLLEEPQAALYSWIQGSEGLWRKQIKVGEIILVVDVGGGTTDFSAIAVVEHDGNLELHRIAVGDHILLGGDNMDLALAYALARKLAEQAVPLDPWQQRALAYACRTAKEMLLSDDGASAVPIVVPSRGARLIGASIRTELTRDEVAETILEGFFPHVELSAKPAARPRAGLTQLGLPYAQDAAITRHLAAFLTRQAAATSGLEGCAPRLAPCTFLHPSAILFNGGVFKSTMLAGRIIETLNRWLAQEGAPPVRELEGADLDVAVARGAAYYGYVRRGGGVRIRGGTAQAYYVGVESSVPAVPGAPAPVQALCIAPFGMEEGTEAESPAQQFGLIVGEPVHFRFFGSSVRRHDTTGLMLDAWAADELQELGEIDLTLPPESRAPGEMVPVRLQAAVTETGTLRLEALAHDSEEHWKVEFDVRGEVRA
ncbi:MAG: Hsp70 family protein [Betaproteobacteria bacterium]|nr:Hsp70 family protein [Betaproteobacteria bacterium]